MDAAPEKTSSSRLAAAPPAAGKRWLKLVPVVLVGASLGYLIYAAGGFGAVVASLARLKFWQLLVCLGFLLADVACDASRYTLVARTLSTPLPWMLGVRVALINLYVAFVTPGAGGAPPAVAWLLKRRGYDGSRALAIALIKGLVGFYALVPIAVGLLLWAPSETVTGVIRAVLAGSGLGLSALLLLMALIALFPERAARLIGKLLGSLHKAESDQKLRGWRRLLHWLDGVLQETAYDLGLYLRGPKLWGLSAFVATLCNIAIFMGLIVFLAPCLGSTASWSELSLLGALYVVMVYMAPTPGGAGLAEGGGLYIFSSILPEAEAAALVIVWRTFTCYIPFLIGALLMGAELGETAPARC